MAVEQVLWAGQRALLVEFGSLAEVMAFHRHVTVQPLEGQVEAVAAARTVLIEFRGRRHAVAASRRVKRLRPKPESVAETRHVEIRVHYDGADLTWLADHLGMSPQALIDWHSSTTWVGAFPGLTPGFTCSVPEDLTQRRRGRRSQHPAVPRREPPRTAVPAGALALAGELSGIYPRSSPGDWQLIGTTDAVMWDSERSSPALIGLGDRVHYVPVAETITVTDPAPTAQLTPGSDADTALEVLDPGICTLVQDLGRRGYARLGVTRSGAAAVPTIRQANQLVGNEDGSACFEVLGGGLELRVRQTLVFAVTGAEAGLEVIRPVAEDRSNMAVSGTGAAPEDPTAEESREVPLCAPFWVFPGERLRVGPPQRGLRSYIAVSGGIAASYVLGSAATDTLSGLGPPPVSAGDRFALAASVSRFVGIADVARSALPEPDSPVVLRFVPGPRADWFASRSADGTGIQALVRQQWKVTDQADRVGIRLAPAADNVSAEPVLRRIRDEELPSEPVVRGALQVPPSGSPVLFLADHPVTGGHPVIGVVVREDLPLAAQLPPGTEVCFQAVDPETLVPQ